MISLIILGKIGKRAIQYKTHKKIFTVKYYPFIGYFPPPCAIGNFEAAEFV